MDENGINDRKLLIQNLLGRRDMEHNNTIKSASSYKIWKADY